MISTIALPIGKMLALNRLRLCRFISFLLVVATANVLHADQRPGHSAEVEAVLVRDVPGELPTLLRVSKVDRRLETMVFFTLPSGSRSGQPVNEIAADLTLPAGKPEDWTIPDLSSAIKQLELLSGRFPTLKSEISSIVGEFKQAAAVKLERLLARSKDPSLSEVDAKSHFSEMDALALMAPEMLPRVEEAKRRRAESKAPAETSPPTGESVDVSKDSLDGSDSVLADASLKIRSTIITYETVRVVLVILVLGILLWLVMVVIFILRRLSANRLVLNPGQVKSKLSSRPPGLFFNLIVVSSTLCLAVGGYLVWKITSSPPTLFESTYRGATEIENDSRLIEINTEDHDDKVICIPPESLNSFFRDHLIINPPNDENARFSLIRNGLAAAQSESGPVLAESLQIFGHPIVIEYHFPETGSDKEVSLNVTANSVPIPGRLSRYLFEAIATELQQAFHESALASRYEFIGVSNRGLLLKSRNP